MKFIRQLREHHAYRMQKFRKHVHTKVASGFTVSALIIACCCGLWSAAFTPVFAASRGDYGTQPSEVLDSVVGEANKTVKIQDTAMDRVTDAQWQFASKYKLANTLDSIRQNIAPYLQWFIFIGLSVATVLIIITGFKLVTSQQSGEDTKKARARIQNIIIGIMILTWFYIVTRIFLSLLSYVLQ